MSISSRTIIAAMGLALASTAGAQAPTNCSDYHRFNCERSADSRFSVNGQSRSAAVKIGEETELNIIVYRGQDYRISVCSDEKILGEALAIRLVEKVRVPKEGAATNGHREFVDAERILWDNTEHEMAQEIEFSCTATKRIAVEINAPGAAEKKGRSADLDIGCAGILVEHMPSPGIGFEPR